MVKRCILNMTKVTMNFSEEEVEIIARLRKDLGMSTNTSTVTQALRIACMMVQEAKAGHQMAIVRENKVHAIVLIPGVSTQSDNVTMKA